MERQRRRCIWTRPAGGQHAGGVVLVRCQSRCGSVFDGPWLLSRLLARVGRAQRVAMRERGRTGAPQARRGTGLVSRMAERGTETEERSQTERHARHGLAPAGPWRAVGGVSRGCARFRVSADSSCRARGAAGRRRGRGHGGANPRQPRRDVHVARAGVLVPFSFSPYWKHMSNH